MLECVLPTYDGACMSMYCLHTALGALDARHWRCGGRFPGTAWHVPGAQGICHAAWAARPQKRDGADSPHRPGGSRAQSSRSGTSPPRPPGQAPESTPIPPMPRVSSFAHAKRAITTMCAYVCMRQAPAPGAVAGLVPTAMPTTPTAMPTASAPTSLHHTTCSTTQRHTLNLPAPLQCPYPVPLHLL